MKGLAAAALAFLATTMNYAEARCVQGTTGGACTINGKPGIYECLSGPGPVCVQSDVQHPKKTCAQSLPVTGVNVPELSGLDAVMTGWLCEYGFHAATLAVVKDKKLVYQRGYGYQDKNLTQPILPDARMRWATNSVFLTKLALNQLIAEGGPNGLQKTDLVYQVVNPKPPTYADPKMKLITVQNLLDDQSCLAEGGVHFKSGSVEMNVGVKLNLHRNATAAEVISYLWTQPSTIRTGCVVGKDTMFTHYPMQVAAQIIAQKTAQKFQIALSNTDPTATGLWYGGYMQYFIAPSGAFTQANNLASEVGPKEIWYNSLSYCDPEYNRKWLPNQPQVLCSYSVDYFAQPGAGGIVASARDYVRLLSKYYFHNGSAKPASLVGTSAPYVFYGSLPGTSSIIFDQISSTGTSLNFALVVNQRVETPNDPSEGELEHNISTYLNGVTKWPTIDLF